MMTPVVDALRGKGRPTIFAAGCLVGCLVGARVASAHVAPVVPPGNSAGNQYVPALPGPGGNQPLWPTGTVPSPGQASPAGAPGAPGVGPRTPPADLALAPRKPEIVAHHGVPGRVVRDLTQRLRTQVRLARSSTNATSPGSTKAASPSASIAELVEGGTSSGLGGVLPVILGVATVAAIAFALRRRVG